MHLANFLKGDNLLYVVDQGQISYLTFTKKYSNLGSSYQDIFTIVLMTIHKTRKVHVLVIVNFLLLSWMSRPKVVKVSSSVASN